MIAIQLEKAPDEDLPFSFSFENQAVLESDTLASGTINGASISQTSGTLTIGATSVSGDAVLARISGGTDGTTYRMKVIGITTGGYDMVGYVDLYVTVPD